MAMSASHISTTCSSNIYLNRISRWFQPRPRTFSGSASSHIQQRITNDDDEKIVEVDGFTLDCDHIPDRLPYDESSMPSEKDIVRTVFEIPKPRRLTPRNATITMLGSANAGKSTLMNLLIRNKVSAISPKRNTTRSNIMGVYSKGLTQLVFIDTPGIVPATESKLYYREMVTDAWNSVQEADIALLLIDAAKKITPVEEYLIKELASLDKPSNFKLSLVLNKVDLVHPKNRLLPLADQLNKRIDFDKTFMVSARNDDGVSDIKSYLIDNCQEGAWRYSSDTVTDLSLTERINEIVREQLFCRLNQEIPYQISLVITAFPLPIRCVLH
uniref:Era-type G domain-containing protein n=1 Tax=Spongospora subterranea TaxID=70186 RepID=A0A0H5QJ26_9EUKA|eukprot:CRZ01291.1 hypothetical protein [Spongospora subterranea]